MLNTSQQKGHKNISKSLPITIIRINKLLIMPISGLILANSGIFCRYSRYFFIIVLSFQKINFAILDILNYTY